MLALREPTNEDTPFAASPRVPYVETKRQAEAVVAAEIEDGLDGVIVNPAFMLGPWDWKPSSGQLLLNVAANRIILAPRGWLSLCDVRDVASGILAALDQGARGRRYVLAGRTMEWIDLLRSMADISGARRPLARCGPAILTMIGWSGDLWRRVTGQEPPVKSAKPWPWRGCRRITRRVHARQPNWATLFVPPPRPCAMPGIGFKASNVNIGVRPPG